MATTYVKIASYTAPSNITDTTFSSIPQTYTDLLLVTSLRGNESYDFCGILFNGSTATFNARWIVGLPATPSSGTRTDNFLSATVANSIYPSTIFATSQLYIPNYTNTSFNKPYMWNGGQGNNNVTFDSYNQLGIGQWATTSAINSIQIVAGDGGTKRIATNSTFYLYGIKNT
jgi:hypothetical protein